jgi:hypothetical protein
MTHHVDHRRGSLTPAQAILSHAGGGGEPAGPPPAELLAIDEDVAARCRGAPALRSIYDDDDADGLHSDLPAGWPRPAGEARVYGEAKASQGGSIVQVRLDNVHQVRNGGAAAFTAGQVDGVPVTQIDGIGVRPPISKSVWACQMVVQCDCQKKC